MDREHFDRLSRLVAAAATRRDALRVLVGGAILSVAGVDAGPAAARDKARNTSRKRGHGKARADVQQPPPPPSCPSACTADCSAKPIRGGVNLTKCDLSGRDLAGVSLAGANLTRACFANATLRDANFRGANLSKTCLCGADLAGADFRGTKVTAQQLACANVTCETTLPNGKPAAPCGQGLTCCNHLCVPTNADPGNCGACGNVCRPPATCQNGRCLIQPGTTCLPPDADLQAAINATGGAPISSTPTLTLCAGRFAAVNLLVSPENAPHGLTIVGAGRDQTILDGQGQSVVLKLQGGGPNTDLAILNLTSLTVTNSGGGLGGLINAADINGGQLAYLTLSDVEVSGNAGAGVVNEGQLALNSGSRITNNTGTFDGGGAYTSNVGAVMLVTANSQIDHNTAVAGGGIFLGAGTVILESAASVHDNFPNNCATEDPSKTIPNCTN